jgi:hypothetical protein
VEQDIQILEIKAWKNTGTTGVAELRKYQWGEHKVFI